MIIMNTGESFILFNKQIKGNKRELIQLGVPIFGHAKDENSNDSYNSGKESVLIRRTQIKWFA